jgi:hypothetical protein
VDQRAGRRVRQRSGEFYEGLLGCLKAFAEREFELAKVVEGSKPPMTMRQHYEGVWKQEFYRPESIPPMLIPVELPDEIRYLWDYFLEMSPRRDTGGMSGGTISSTELRAWMQNTGVTLSAWEVRALDLLEALRKHVPTTESQVEAVNGTGEAANG